MHKFETTKKAFRVYHAYNRKYFPLKLLHIIFSNASPYFNLWLSAEIVTALYAGKEKQELLTLVAITLFGNLLLTCIGALLRRVVDNQYKILENNEAAALNYKTLSLDYDQLENAKIRQHRRKIIENSYINGYGIHLMRSSIEALATNFINLLFSMLFFTEMLSLVVCQKLSPLGIILLVALVLFVILGIWSSSISVKKQTEAWNEVGDLMLDENRLAKGYSTDGLDNRIYRQQDIISAINAKMAKLHLKTFSHANNISAIYSVPELIFSRLSELCAYLIVCMYCRLGIFPIGSVIKYVGYLGMLTNNITNLFYNRNQLRDNEPFLKVYLDYFDIPSHMYQGSLSVEKRSDKRFEIEFKDVSFRYQGTANDALKHINLKLTVGERLAVVGMNGSGKTTFIKLLCRLYDPTAGEIIMNDFNVRKYNYREYLDLFSIVFQDYKLLALPLGNNIASAEHWDSIKAERLLEEVGFKERYAQMPKKLDTPIYKDFDEDGVNLSGGEAQKLALARALYRDAPFIILDEPTAALDPIAEAEIYSKFNDIVGDKTAIYISHRLSSCRFCDKIAVFDNGEIVQLGTHEELLADEHGKYYELWHAQAQYYTHTI